MTKEQTGTAEPFTYAGQSPPTLKYRTAQKVGSKGWLFLLHTKASEAKSPGSKSAAVMDSSAKHAHHLLCLLLVKYVLLHPTVISPKLHF